jgi:hypothetical protein
MKKHISLQDGDKYLKQMLVLGGEILRTFDMKASERSSIIATINFLYWSWDEFRMKNNGPSHLDLGHIVSDDDFGFIIPNEEEFFQFYGQYIVSVGATILEEVEECFKGDRRAEDNWLESAEKYIDKLLYFGSKLFCTLDLKRYNQGIILNTLSFLFENWKDMRQEEWNDAYISLEELVNSAEFSKTEEERNMDKIFCAVHQDAIQKVGVLLQVDLYKQGFFEPKESATFEFFKNNPDANPFKEGDL